MTAGSSTRALARDPIDALIRQAATSPDVIGLGGGLPSPSLFPRRALAESFYRVLRRYGDRALQYGWPEGEHSLRERIARRLMARAAPGVHVAPENVIVTSGAQQALAIVVQLLLRRGATIGVEPASYPAALKLFRARGLKPRTLEGSRSCYVMPALGNPSGHALPPTTLARILARSPAIIEDDAYGELRFTEPRAPLLGTSPRVFHVGTFSKTLCPGLRVGWLVVPPAYRKRALAIKQDDDLQANGLSQAVVDDYLAHNDFDEHIARLRRSYRRRAARLADAVTLRLPGWRFRFPEGGFGLWLETEHTVDERRFLKRALEAGVSFDAGSGFQALSTGGEPTRVRLCFSSTSPTLFLKGATRLARAWRHTRRATRRA